MARYSWWLACATAAFVSLSVGVQAQKMELTPFFGYRLGDDLALAGSQVSNGNGGSSVGLIGDVLFGPPTDGIKVEALFSRQRIDRNVRPGPFDPVTVVHVDVDHIQVGGIYELSDGRARPFLSGLAGLTRYGAPGGSEFRFALGGGAGMKLFATPHIGLRLDGRLYSTFVDTGSASVCGGNGCLLVFRVTPAWQFDATAGLIVAF